MKQNNIEYIAPDIECIEINVEGVLCSSPDTKRLEDGGEAWDF